MPRPFRRSGPRRRADLGWCGRPLLLGLAFGPAPRQAQEDVVEARLAQGEAGHRDLGGVERAQHLGPHGRAVLDGELHDVVVDGRRFVRERRQECHCRRHHLGTPQGDGDHRSAEIGLEVGRRPLGDDSAVVDDHDVAGQAVGLLEVLGGEEHGRPLRNQVLDHAPEVLAALWVETRRRLVEEQDRRAGDERGGQIESAPHAPQYVLRTRLAASARPKSRAVRRRAGWRPCV